MHQHACIERQQRPSPASPECRHAPIKLVSAQLGSVSMLVWYSWNHSRLKDAACADASRCNTPCTILQGLHGAWLEAGWLVCELRNVPLGGP
jgi:hypothetical protein